MEKCECCERDIKIVFGGTKFCNQCSIYIFKIRTENHALKRKIQIRDKRIKKLENNIAENKHSYKLT